MKAKVNPLLKKLPKNQCEKVFNQDYCDIDFQFLGFTDTYKYLAKLIPKHFIVIDFGCAYNPQCFYFTKHKKYFAVDVGKIERFKSDNCEIFEMTIKEFIKKYRFNLDETFAILNYVPPWHDDNCKLVRENFINIYCFYPHGGI